MDTNILIRSMTCIGESISFRAGGGIVADSKPSDEYRETLDKAAALSDAIRGAAPEVSNVLQARA